MRQINPLDYSLKTLPNLAAGHLAIAHAARGPCRALLEGSVGGAQAVGQAARMIAEGTAEAVLCGGADALLEEMLFASYWGLGLVASDAGDRAGFVPGEGSGVMVLEEAERARRRGAAIRGEILGFAAAAGDGRLAPEADAEALGRRLARVIGEALDEAGRMPDIVALHADGLAAHDEGERLALGRARRTGVERCPRLGFKRAHGDLGAASTPVELLACSLAIEYGMLPAGIVNGGGAGAAPPERALVLSLGLFGECAALVLGKPERPAEATRAG
jgi:3-oxoacyl-[acyl-carrier-protein] synthase II